MLGDRVHLVAEPKAAQDLQAAKTQVAGLRVEEDLPSLFDQKRADPMFGEQRRRGQAAGSGADDEHGNTGLHSGA